MAGIVVLAGDNGRRNPRPSRAQPIIMTLRGDVSVDASMIASPQPPSLHNDWLRPHADRLSVAIEWSIADPLADWPKRLVRCRRQTVGMGPKDRGPSPKPDARASAGPSGSWS